MVETWGLTGQRVEDFSLYAGTLGTAFLVFKSYQLTHNKNDLGLCLEIVKACNSSSIQSRSGCPSAFAFSSVFTFITIF